MGDNQVYLILECSRLQFPTNCLTKDQACCLEGGQSGASYAQSAIMRMFLVSMALASALAMEGAALVSKIGESSSSREMMKYNDTRPQN